jgi:hypothetical protein
MTDKTRSVIATAAGYYGDDYKSPGSVFAIPADYPPASWFVDVKSEEAEAEGLNVSILDENDKRKFAKSLEGLGTKELNDLADLAASTSAATWKKNAIADAQANTIANGNAPGTASTQDDPNPLS